VRCSALRALLDAAEAGAAADPDVARVDHDSRAVAGGSLYCCVPGAVADGHDFAADALARGAVALLVERVLPLPVPQLVVPDVRAAMAPAAAAVAGWPSRELTVVGVTGTNGKTTVTHLLERIFAAAGRPCAVSGTLSGARTTPEAPDLQRWLAARRDEGRTAIAMEVSSHALELHRVDGTRFAMAVFTNLSRDHLDFHHSMEAYFRAKARLFTPELSTSAVVNLDDPHGRLLLDAAQVPTTGYRLADAEELVLAPGSSTFRWRGEPVELHLGGRFNVSNALAAAEAALGVGVAPDVVAAGLSTPVVVSGRFERVEGGQPFDVVVDYAHTPDALEQVLSAARELVGEGRVLVVFGCGGERDRSKRPAMGEVAARLADVVVLTADNSRSESTTDILAAIRAGYDSASPRRAHLHVEPDRAAAIAVAVDAATPGDIVVIAGKGHEATQVLGDEVIEHDDRVVAREALARRSRPSASPRGGATWSAS
jgi:UDP-N-acetylmuramoyl-L-alanyl-D-glutamate--2,6-diaminopimelate ligase